VFIGCANQAGEDNRNVARMAALLAGLPPTVGGVTLNRLCASGADAVGTAARAVMTGELQLALAGGVESMTRAPFVMAKSAQAWGRQAEIHDTTIGWRFVNPAMAAGWGTDSMPETAENVAEAFGITRTDQDSFALQSQQRAAQAMAAGYFANELVPVSIKDRTSTKVFERDEHPRPDTSLNSLSSLKPIVRKDGTVTAGNASGINDGAAAMIVAGEGAIRQFDLVPRARVLGMATTGVEPRLMGIGPVPACRKLLDRLRLRIETFDIIELNEAFASQVIASLRELGISSESERVNPFGGAIALGHPLGMTGARLVQTAIHGLEVTNGKRALVTMCVGVGQGLAMALERP
jgi:3-oxoadipyl-CoA thiolase